MAELSWVNWVQLGTSLFSSAGIVLLSWVVSQRLSLQMERIARISEATKFNEHLRAQRDEAMEHLRASWQARTDEAANRNGVQCGVQRADGAPCTLEREHLGQPHSYAGTAFEQIFDGFACPLCGRRS